MIGAIVLGLFLVFWWRYETRLSKSRPEIDTESVSPEYVREKLRWR